MSSSPAKHRYNRRVLWLSTAYALALFGAMYLIGHQLVAGIAAYPVAVLPALPIVGIFVAVGAYLFEERDEYLRMLMVRQTLWASGFAVSVATIWGVLEGFELVGHVQPFYVAVLWFVGLGLGGIVNRLTVARAA